MGNELGKVFRDEDDEYEVTFSVKKKIKDGASEEEEPEQSSDDQTTAPPANGNAAESEGEMLRRSTRKREPPAPTGMPLSSASGKAMKSSAGRPVKIALEAAGGGDEIKTPRGRRSTCVTIGDTQNPSLKIRMLKSHLAPLYYLTIPADFVTKYMKENQNYEIVNGGQCRQLQIRTAKTGTSRFVFDKDFWHGYVKEHSLALNDSIHLELVGDLKVRIDIVRAPPLEVVPFNDPAEASTPGEVKTDLDETADPAAAPAEEATPLSATD